jgi:hypothetical protein
MIEQLTTENVKDYMDTNYGGTKLDVDCLVSACQWVSQSENVGEVDLFHLLIENEPIKGSTLQLDDISLMRCPENTTNT